MLAFAGRSVASCHEPDRVRVGGGRMSLPRGQALATKSTEIGFSARSRTSAAGGVRLCCGQASRTATGERAPRYCCFVRFLPQSRLRVCDRDCLLPGGLYLHGACRPFFEISSLPPFRAGPASRAARRCPGRHPARQRSSSRNLPSSSVISNERVMSGSGFARSAASRSYQPAIPA